MKQKRFTADFETATWFPDKTFVWAWAVCEIGEENILIGNKISDFISLCEGLHNAVIYFHNLKFDGEFILSYLLENGFTFIEDRKEAKDKTFTTLVSDLGVFYQITVYFKRQNKNVVKVTFYDSLKIIPFSVSQIAKSFNLEESKLSIDYNAPRSEEHILTPEEKDYIKNDVIIVAKALNVLFSEGLTKMTQGANALFDYTEILTKKRFEHFFPALSKDVDNEIRKAYKGGFTYLNPLYEEKEVKSGCVLDVNSLYPSVMYEKMLPYGEPVFFEGKYKEDKIYTLYIQMISCSFKIKENMIPTIQIKNDKFHFIENEYLETSGNEIVVLTLTSVDLKLFFEHYTVTDLEYIAGWKFKAIDSLFKDYIDKWITRKNKATIEKNKGQRTLAKLMLNALYGKFATSLKAVSKKPVLKDGIVTYELLNPEEKKRIIYSCTVVL